MISSVFESNFWVIYSVCWAYSYNWPLNRSCFEYSSDSLCRCEMGRKHKSERVSTKSWLKLQRKICGTAQLFVPTFLLSLALFSAPPTSLSSSLRKWSLALLSPSPEESDRSFKSSLFDNPPASRFTTCWVLRFSSLSPVQTQCSFIPH